MTSTSVLPAPETVQETKPVPPLAHLWCRTCILIAEMLAMTKVAAACGHVAPISRVNKTSPSDPDADRCVVCLEMSSATWCPHCGVRWARPS